MQKVVSAKRAGEGLSVTYPAAPELIWPAIEAALNWSSAARIVDHRAEGYFLVFFEGASGNPRTFAGVWVEPAGEKGSRVTVVSRRQAPLRGSALSEADFQDDLASALRFAKDGKPFPLVRPD